MRFVPLLATAFGLGLLCGACGADDKSSSSSAVVAASGCAADDRKDIFTAGLSKSAGSLSVKILDASPAPPAKGTNTMTIEIVDGAGKPLDGATVTVKPFMPDHGHGSAVVPVVTPLGGGTYEVAKIYLAMAGLWKITFSVEPKEGGALQEAAFQFCLDG